MGFQWEFISAHATLLSDDSEAPLREGWSDQVGNINNNNNACGSPACRTQKVTPSFLVADGEVAPRLPPALGRGRISLDQSHPCQAAPVLRKLGDVGGMHEIWGLSQRNLQDRPVRPAHPLAGLKEISLDIARHVESPPRRACSCGSTIQPEGRAQQVSSTHMYKLAAFRSASLCCCHLKETNPFTLKAPSLAQSQSLPICLGLYVWLSCWQSRHTF